MKPVLLVIPGLDGDPRLLQRLPWPTAYDIVVFDHTHDPAHGGVEALAEHALALVPANAPLVVCGESFGSTVALTLARLYPERVRGLLLLSGFGWYPWPNRAFVHFGMFSWRMLGDRVAAVFLKIGRILGPLVELTRNIVDYSQLAEPDLAAYRAKCQLVLSFDARPWLTELRCPSLIVGGRVDLVVPSAASRHLAQRIVGAELHQLAGGHIAHLSRPDKAERIVTAWLQRLAVESAADLEAIQRLEGLVPDNADVANKRA